MQYITFSISSSSYQIYFLSNRTAGAVINPSRQTLRGLTASLWFFVINWDYYAKARKDLLVGAASAARNKSIWKMFPIVGLIRSVVMGRGGRGSGMGGMRGGGISRGGGGIRSGGVGRNFGGSGGRAGRGSLAPPPRVNTPRPGAPPRGGMSGGAGFGLGLGTGLLLGGGRRRGFGWGRRGMMMGPGMGMGGHGMRRGGCGCSSLIVVIVVFVLLMSVILLINEGNPLGNDPLGISPGTTVPTHVRERLGAEHVTDVGPMYTDNLGWIGNSAQMYAGLRVFFEQTGVRPHVYITDEINGSNNPTEQEVAVYASNLYDDLFDDEGHLLLIFIDQEDFPTRPLLHTLPGDAAGIVMDAEAQNILHNQVMYYNSQFFETMDVSEEQIFSNAFARTAEIIMFRPPEPPDNRPIWITLIVVSGVVLFALILFNFWKKRQIQKNLEAEQTERILSQDLSTFSEDDASRLARQYEEEQK